MNELQELLNRAFIDGDTGAYNKLSGAYNELSKKLEQTDYELGQALRVARQYKAQLERCEALAREAKG